MDSGDTNRRPVRYKSDIGQNRTQQLYTFLMEVLIFPLKLWHVRVKQMSQLTSKSQCLSVWPNACSCTKFAPLSEKHSPMLQEVILNVVTPPSFTNTSESRLDRRSGDTTALFCQVQGINLQPIFHSPENKQMQVSPAPAWPGAELAVRSSLFSTLQVNTTSLGQCYSWENWGPGNKMSE